MSWGISEYPTKGSVVARTGLYFCGVGDIVYRGGGLSSLFVSLSWVIFIFEVIFICWTVFIFEIILVVVGLSFLF